MRRLFRLVVFAVAWAVIGWAQPWPVDAVLTTGGGENFGFPTEQTSGPVVYDLTGDGEKELIVTGRRDIWVLSYADQDPEQAVFHWQPQGQPEFDAWEFCSPITIAHLTPDGYPWVVVGASVAVHYEPEECPGLVNGDCPAWDGHAPYPDPDCHHDGDCYHWKSIIHAWKIVGTEDDPQPSDVIMNARLTTPVAADVDGDGLDELCFVGNGSYGVHSAHTWSDMYSTVGVHFFRYNNGFVGVGDSRKEVPWGLELYTGLRSKFRQIAQTVPAAGDLNGDGLPEFVAQCLWRVQAWTFASNPEGALLWEDSTYNLDHLCMPAKCFINFGTRTSNETNVSVSWPYTDYTDPGNNSTTGDAERSPGPVLVDMDGDGQLDVFVQTGDGGAYIWKFDGQDGTHSRSNFYESYGANWGEVASGSELGLCDDGNDGHPNLFETMEVLNGDFDPTHWLKTRRWNGSLNHEDGHTFPAAFPYVREPNVYPRGDLYTLALLPSEIGNAFTLDIAAYDSVIFQRTDIHDSWQLYLGDHGGPVQSGITASDVNDDGLMEYVLSNRINATQTHLYALPTERPFSPERNEWMGYRNGPAHTGLFAQPVSGDQQVQHAVWKGRIIVHGIYSVDVGQTLEIKPGTVVELREGASLQIWGTLLAQGTEKDSIYFKADGATSWGDVVLSPGAVATLEHCVIHEGRSIFAWGCTATIQYNTIFDMDSVGVDVKDAKCEYFLCGSNHIASCGRYGIRGTTSAGTFSWNRIEGCNRAGIYWAGDRAGTLESPLFSQNTVSQNGIAGAGAIAGAAFYTTTARLECNTFDHNTPVQVLCGTQGNVVMNGNSVTNGRNFLLGNGSDLWCAVSGKCQWTPPPTGFSPLMWLSGAIPQLNYGENSFEMDGDGIYILHMGCSPQLAIKHNYFSPYTTPPPDNTHFCPQTSFYAPPGSFSESSLECLSGGGLSGVLPLYQEAASAEAESDFNSARAGYTAVVEQYPDSEEALWATRGSLRAGLAGNQSSALMHDSLTGVWLDESLPEALRHSARREAVWALVAGRHYQSALGELQGIMAQADEDSLWAAIAAEIVALTEEGDGSHTQSIGAGAQTMQQKVSAFHSRLHRLLGEETDSEVLASNKPVAQSEKLSRAYPNPFNSTVNIAFELQQDVQVRLEVFNLMGQKVATLANEPLKAGSHTFNWSGEAMSSGVYFYRLQAGKTIETQKLMLLK